MAADAADFTFAAWDWVRRAENLVRLYKQVGPVKLFSAFKVLESVAINLRGFQYIISIADLFTKLVQIVPLKRIRSVDVFQAYLDH